MAGLAKVYSSSLFDSCNLPFDVEIFTAPSLPSVAVGYVELPLGYRAAELAVENAVYQIQLRTTVAIGRATLCDGPTFKGLSFRRHPPGIVRLASIA